MITHRQFLASTDEFIENKKYKKGHAIKVRTDSCVLVSAPHGVSQTRLGKQKLAEPGSARLAAVLSDICQTNLIIKTKNMFDDANFDDKSRYKRDIKRIVKEENIKYVLDFHGLAAKRECDINLGINFGQNIQNNVPLFENLAKALQKEGFCVNIDNPFCAKYSTVAFYAAKKCNVWAIQIEVNCKITNIAKNIYRLNKLINVLAEFILSLN